MEILSPTVRTVGFFILLGLVIVLVLALIFRPNFRRDILGSQGEAKVLGLFTVNGAGFFALIALILGGAIYLAIPVGLEPPEVDTPEESSDTRPEFKGKAKPGADVEIFANGERLGRAKADSETGVWRFQPLNALSVGKYEISAKAVFQGKTSETSAPRMLTIINPEVPPIVKVSPPSIARPTPSFSTVRAKIFGMAEPRSAVMINVDGKDIGRAMAKADGTWEYTFGSPLAVGSHPVKAKVILRGTESAYSQPVTLVVRDRLRVVPVRRISTIITVKDRKAETIPMTLRILLRGEELDRQTFELDSGWAKGFSRSFKSTVSFRSSELANTPIVAELIPKARSIQFRESFVLLVSMQILVGDGQEKKMRPRGNVEYKLTKDDHRPRSFTFELP